MGYIRGVVVDILRSWIGKKESDNTNRTIIDIYNTISPLPRGYKVKYTDDWCAACVSAAFQKAGYIGIIPAECSCYYMVEGAKKMGIWVENDDFVPKPGDIVMYDWQDDGKGDNRGVPDHVGVVELVDGNNIIVIEGNHSDSVKRRTIAVNGKYIRGFITPKYTANTITPKIAPQAKMKYSDANPPAQCFMNQSTWANGALKNGRPVGILWHDTAAGNPELRRYVQPDDNAPDRDEWLKKLGKNKYGNDWNHIDIETGLNCWVGKLADGTVTTVQAGPWTTHAWGCGGGSKGSCNGYTKDANGKTKWVEPFWIQFEICDDGYNDPNYFSVAYEEACQITAYLCKKFGIDPKGTVQFNGVTVPTILCHQDSHKLGLGNNHGDVYKWFNKYNYNMDNVRNDVEKLLKSDEIPAPSPEPHEFKVGEVVNFTGTVHYTSANATTGKPCKSGPAKITSIYKLGSSKHPYHLIAVSGQGSTVYGWVDEKYAQALSNEPVREPVKDTAPTPTKEVRASIPAYNGPDKSIAGTYVTTTQLNIRDGAGTKYKSLTVMPKGTAVKNYGYYSLVGNTKWLYIQVTLNGVKYTGFSSSSYLKKN